jgi:hypothetical protein
MGIALDFFAPLPGEDLIDLRQNELRPLTIEFGPPFGRTACLKLFVLGG